MKLETGPSATITGTGPPHVTHGVMLIKFMPRPCQAVKRCEAQGPPFRYGSPGVFSHKMQRPLGAIIVMPGETDNSGYGAKV